MSSGLRYGWGLFLGDEDGGEMLEAGDCYLRQETAAQAASGALTAAIQSGLYDPEMLNAVVFVYLGTPDTAIPCQTFRARYLVRWS